MGQQTIPIINAFTAGELSPHLEGRTDHEKYYSGCRRLENFIPRPHGSVYKRPGTRFVARAKYGDRAARLIAFDFNSTASQSYVLELGHEYLRFHKDGGVILGEENEPYEIATPWTEDMLWSVNTVQSCDVLYLVHPQVRPHKLTRAGHADWTLAPMAFSWPGHDYAIADANGDGLADGKQNDTLSVPAGCPMEVSMLVSGQSPNGTARWFVYKGGGIFDAGDQDRVLTFKDSPVEDSDQIESVHKAGGAVNSKFWEPVDVDHTMPEVWVEGNWPGVAALYEDRLVLAATPSQPLTLWLSSTGSYGDFRLNTASYVDGIQDEPLDDDAIEISLSGSRINPIRWIMDSEELLVGTNASEVKVWSGTSGEGMTPSRVQRKRQSAHGSAFLPAQLISNEVLFISRSGRKVRRMAFDFASDRYTAPEITLLADHITGTGLQDLDFAREPDGILWVVRSDGVLAGCTYLAEQSVVAWHRHPLGGDGACESVASIPGEDGDETWLLVRRSIGGQVQRMLERLVPAPAVDGDASDAFHVDCGLSSGLSVSGFEAANPLRLIVPGHGASEGETVRVQGVQGMEGEGQYTVTAPDEDSFALSGVDGSGLGTSAPGGTVWRLLSEVSGLDHLEGETVDILADGAVHLAQTVQGGSVRLNRPAWKVHAGYGFGAVLQPMRLETGAATGTSQTMPKRILAVTLRFKDTVGGKVCPGDDVSGKYERVLPHVQPARAGEAPRPFSGDRELRLSAGFDRDGLFTVRQDDPLPMTVICCVPRVQGGG
ncbi:hypothetical protein [Desulfovibrio ferrophilus]|uniref:Uncharacterized protein n=1 Tax=Desulfovibrio ferrophilus TaxID=241368 RepID=A0A2Z6AZP9_9BACT|nr:hypothetical protein [Desulfovibrio ferrophilus]BBD08747.1 putative uncharacterized protein [Desulfovibrio ferrophilus]